MSTHPDLAPIYHPFIRAAWLGKTDRYTKLCKCSEARQKENDEGMMPVYGDDTYESCRGKMDQNVKSAEEKVSNIRVNITFTNNSQSTVQDLLRKRTLVQCHETFRSVRLHAA